jgi:hypothetical protein
MFDFVLVYLNSFRVFVYSKILRVLLHSSIVTVWLVPLINCQIFVACDSVICVSCESERERVCVCVC